MSLLIKALEQAAKDRDNAKPRSRRTHAPATSAPGLEPTIEPAPPPRSIPDLDHTPAPGSSPIPEPSYSPRPPRVNAGPSLETPTPPRPTPASQSAPDTTRSPSTPPVTRTNPALAVDTTAASRLAAKSSASMANIDAQHQRARAATVMQASATRSSAVWSYLTRNPVAIFGAVAGLGLVAFGVYVYLQVAQPGLFARAPAKRSPEKTSPAVLPPPQSAGATPDPYPATAAAKTANAPGEYPLAPPALQPSVAGDIGASPAPAPGLALPASPGGPISAAAVIGAPHAAEMAREAPLGRELTPASIASSRREQVSTTQPGSGAPAARSAPAKSIDSARSREAITVTPALQPRLNPSLSLAYGALQAGKLEESGTLYAKVAQSEPLNIDALLGMAYIAAQENRTDDAVKLYVRILHLNPRHAAAQAALIGAMGRADPLSAETRVKQLIAQEPSAFPHFVLGNLYADQSQWAQAQQSYFQAHHLEPDNPDYAYNLAISLDHLSQSKLALSFYRRAEQLATKQARANFNLLHARERITALSSKLE